MKATVATFGWKQWHTLVERRALELKESKGWTRVHTACPSKDFSSASCKFLHYKFLHCKFLHCKFLHCKFLHCIHTDASQTPTLSLNEHKHGVEHGETGCTWYQSAQHTRVCTTFYVQLGTLSQHPLVCFRKLTDVRLYVIDLLYNVPACCN